MLLFLKVVKRLLFCILISFSFGDEMKVETSITGSVVRQGNNAPLSGANVMLFSIDGLKLGTIQMKLECFILLHHLENIQLP